MESVYEQHLEDKLAVQRRNQLLWLLCRKELRLAGLADHWHDLRRPKIHQHRLQIDPSGATAAHLLQHPSQPVLANPQTGRRPDANRRRRPDKQAFWNLQQQQNSSRLQLRQTPNAILRWRRWKQPLRSRTSIECTWFQRGLVRCVQ